MYITQKKFSEALSGSNKKLVLIVTAQAAMVVFYQALAKDFSDSRPYISIGSQDINKDGKVTFKGFAVLDALYDQFQEIEFTSYKRKIIKMKKEDK